MPLPPPVSRQLRHRRAIRVEAFARDDGLWDIEGCLTDHKPHDVALAPGVRPNGLPIHELWLRITIDRKLTVVDAQASSDWVPYPGHCEVSHPAYRALIGLNLLDDFRRQARLRLGGTAGCTHLTELCAVLPTAAIQAFAGEAWNMRDGARGAASAVDESEPPFQLDRCHALRFDGEAVRRFYPRWYGHVPRGEARVGVAAGTGGTNEVGDYEVQSNS